jgi:phosphomannomutase
VHCGGIVDHCGFVPSPAVAAYGFARGIPSLMVTGSHIPDDRNGIKFNRADGEVLKPDEAAIRAQGVDLPDLFDAAGMLRTALPRPRPAMRQRPMSRGMSISSGRCARRAEAGGLPAFGGGPR